MDLYGECNKKDAGDALGLFPYLLRLQEWHVIWTRRETLASKQSAPYMHVDEIDIDLLLLAC